MMRPSNDQPEVYLCREAIDFRKGISGLSVLVEDTLCLEAYAYLRHIYTELPRAQTAEDMAALLPGNVTAEQIKI